MRFSGNGPLVIALALCLVLGGRSAMAQQLPVPDLLAPYEKTLFSETYASDTREQRLERLESLVFGEAQSGDAIGREQRLLQVLQTMVPAASTALSTPSSPPSLHSLPGLGAGEPNGGFHSFPSSARQPALQPPRKPDATDYPAVTAMERNVFGRDFVNQDLTVRLDRLEKKVMGATYPDLPLMERVDKLSMRVSNGGSSLGGEPTVGVVNLPNSVGTAAKNPASSAFHIKLTELEKATYNGQSYPDKLVTERLDQLESDAYGYSYRGESPDTRLTRLLQGFGSRYSNGSAYQSRPPVQARQPMQPNYSSPLGGSSHAVPAQTASVAPRRNVQIGGGFHSSSNSTHQFSPEMMEMLPDDVRRQLGGSSVSNSSQSFSSGSYSGIPGVSSTTQSYSGGYTASAPGTVIIQETREYPGFYNYSGRPMGYRNFYQTPGGIQPQTYSSQTTTQIGGQSGGFFGGAPNPNSDFAAPFPNSNTGVQTYTYNQPLTTTGQPIPNTAYYSTPYGYHYAGDPALLQQLNNLELNVYGQIKAALPVPVRLNEMEATLLGQNYAGYSDVDRINQLQRTYQAQSVGKMMGRGSLGKWGRAAGSMIMGVPMNQAQPQTLPPIK